MDIRLIATDMDGTLLDNEKNVSDRSRRALTLAAERGIEIVPATGRMLDMVPEEVLSFPFVRYPSLPLANYLHNKIFPDFARFSLLFFASYVIIIM